MGKHIPLFRGCSCCPWLPYTALLLFEQCFQKIGNCRVRKWMVRFKPFFDVYLSPFRGKHRYWVGLARAALLLVFGLNSPMITVWIFLLYLQWMLYILNSNPTWQVHPNGTGKCIRFWGGSYTTESCLSLSWKVYSYSTLQCLQWKVCMSYQPKVTKQPQHTHSLASYVFSSLDT